MLDQGRRGGAADCLGISALWLDVDIAGPAHKAAGLPQTREEAVALVRLAPTGPRAVVSSGYGLQCWWSIPPLGLDESLEALAQWQATWEDLAGRMDLRLDNVFNIDRIMRLPGTFNFKGPEPVPVTIRDNGVRHDFHKQIKPWLIIPEPPEQRAKTSTAHLAGSRFNEMVHPCAVLLDAGWEPSGTAPGQEHFHYPGASNQTSATVYLEDLHCSIWSETAVSQTALELHHSYDAYGLWTCLKFGGDFVVSHAWLVAHDIPDLGGSMGTAPGPRTLFQPQLVTVVASQVMTVAVDWYWPGWLPAGKLATLDGDPSTGKSTMTLDLAARLTTGAVMPDGAGGGQPRNVILLSGEDDMDDTIVWRLLAAGADLARVTHVAATLVDGQESPFTIPGDLPALESLINDLDAALVIVDVLNEYLSETVDSHKDQSVRRVLHQLKLMASRTNASVLMLRHLRKEGSDKAIYRGGGSIGIVGAVRAGWTIGIHPDDEAQRVLACVKANLAPKPPALGFRLLPHDSFPCAYVDWSGVVDLGADELLNPGKRGDPDEASQLKFAMDAIDQLLPPGVEMPSQIFLEALRELGLSKNTIDRARAKKGVMSRKIGKADEQGNKGWAVRLPADDSE